MKIIKLFLLLSLGLWAENNVETPKKNDEIGIPVISWEKAQIESAVLASDGKSFYTLQGDDLIQWNLSPLKKLQAWKVPLKKITTGEKQNRFHDIWFLDNYTKVLITSIDGMMIYNLKTHKVDKQVDYVSHSLVKDGNLIYLTHPTLIKGFEYNIDLEVWSIPELKRVKNVNITEMGRKHIEVCYGSEDINSVLPSKKDCPITHLANLVVGMNNIYYPTHYDQLLILNKSTLEFKGFDKYLSSQGGGLLELLENGYMNTGLAIYRLSDDKVIYHPDRGTTYKYAKEHNLKVLQSLRWNSKPRRYSVVGTLGLTYGSKAAPYILFRLNKKERFFARIWQYKRDLIIQAKAFFCADYKKGINCFEETSKHSSILQMKTQDGRIIPINDATYNKYHTNFNIGD